MTAARPLCPEILREYDIRGIAGAQLSAVDAYAVGRAFATMAAERVRPRPLIAVGCDGRLSSPELEAALVDGLVDQGAVVRRVGVGPTPMLYFAAATLPADAAVMVTGSHNPPDHNGFKMVMAGQSFFGADIRALADIVAAGGFPLAAKGEAADIVVLEDYIERLMAEYDGVHPLTVVWDAGNGATGEAVLELAQRLPGTHIVLNSVIDGTFPFHHPDPIDPANLSQLIDAVTRYRADLGVAFDGDGDRLGVVDAKGRILWADQTMMFLAEEVLAACPGAPVVADVKASQSLFDRIKALGGVPVMCPSGRSLIRMKMDETGAPLAGEMSGHLFFADRYLGYDDALYGAIRFIAMVARWPGTTLADRFDALPHPFNTPELKASCADGRKQGAVAEVRERLRRAGASMCEIDGVRVTTADGWWLLRASNTKAALVARCESDTTEGLARLVDTLKAELAAVGLALD